MDVHLRRVRHSCSALTFEPTFEIIPLDVFFLQFPAHRRHLCMIHPCHNLSEAFHRIACPAVDVVQTRKLVMESMFAWSKAESNFGA
jgi:hypothetical protein